MRRSIVELVHDRSGGACEAATPACVGTAMQIHHVLMRSQGGGDHPDNLLHVCMPCHRWIHGHPARAYDWGLLRRSGQRAS